MTLEATSASRVRPLRVATAPPSMCLMPPSTCLPACLSVQQRKYDLHYRIALVVNYLGHCVSVAALVAAFLLFLTLR